MPPTSEILELLTGLVLGSGGVLAWNSAKIRRGEQRLATADIERVQHKYEQILNSAGEGIMTTDVRGHITFTNPAAALMLGWSSEEMIGAPLHELIHHTKADGSPYPVEECPAYEAFRRQVTYHSDHDLFWRKNASSFPTATTSAPILDPEGKPIGSVIVFSDISRRQAMEEMKNEFVSTVSHELRTPLTSIRGVLGLLAGGRLGPLEQQAKRMTELALSNSERLIRLINDILDLERLESRRMPMDKLECDAQTLIKKAADEITPVAEKAGIEISINPTLSKVWADPDRILQTLTNLLSNAIKFSQPGGTVTVSSQRRAHEVVFSVIDQGAGIPAEKLEMIFERFRQVDSSDSRARSGSGLGLAISRSIVVQHGGRIWVESEPGKGSAFYFSLPAAEQRTASDSDHCVRQVLVCDDDDGVRSVIQELLELRGYQVIAVSSGTDALTQAAARIPDLILIDLMMPGINGWDTITALKTSEETKHIPIIVISVFSPYERDTSRNAAAWVPKPVDCEALYSALDQVLPASEIAAAESDYVETHPAH